jgi:hypothetical protein
MAGSLSVRMNPYSPLQEIRINGAILGGIAESGNKDVTNRNEAGMSRPDAGTDGLS